MVEVARWRADQQSHEVAFTFLADGETLEEHLTYATLDRRARAVGAELQARGLSGERVLLVFNPGLDFNAALFACMYAGAVAVPVYPPDPFRAHRTLPRLEAIVRDAQAALVLGSQEILAWAGASIAERCGAPVLEMDGIPDEQAEDWQPVAPDPGRLALLQYTSGSTGTPRGVMLTHGNLTHNLRALDRLNVDGAVAVCWVPPFHDMGLIGGLLMPIHCGRKMVLMSPLRFVERPVRWLWAVSRYGAQTSPSPNFGFEICIRKVAAEDCEGLDLRRWTAAINGAEPVRAETIDRFLEKFAPYGFRREAFFPAYGMAESTVLVTCGQRCDPVLDPTFSASALAEGRVVEVAPGSADGRRLVGCGQPIPESDLAVVDPRTCRRLPAGRVGELWVRSGSVGLGYWNRPDETREVFGARVAGERGPAHLRTGDLGFVHRGAVFVTGRLKELVILGGRNYYPHDIERVAARAHPAIKPDGCAAFSVETNDGEQLVVVAEVVRPKRIDLGQVLQAVRREVVEDMEISPYAVALIAAGALPKTSSGKTRRRAVRERYLKGEIAALAEWRASAARTDAVGPQPADPPQSPLEEEIAFMFGEVLGLAGVGRDEDFFALGGHSLRAVQLAGRLSAELGVEVSLPVLFQYPTVAALAAWIGGRRNGRAKTAALVRPAGIPRREADAPGVLSSAEQRLWFFDRLAPGHPYYNLPVAARLSGPLDAEVLERALAEIVARHEALRTTYPAEGGLPVRRIASRLDVPLARVDLSGLAPDRREAELQRLLAEEARRPFDLAAGPLVRLALYRLAEEEHVLLIAAHHIVVDGWSLGVIARELGHSYAAIRDGLPSPLPPAQLDYADFAAWQQERLAGGALESEAAYWRGRLTPEPPFLELPYDRPRPPRQSFQGALRPVELGPDLSERVRRLAAGERTTPFAVLMAAYDVVLSRYCRSEDVAVGTIAANRTRKELEPLVGFFANTLVVRADLSGDPTFRELVARVSKTALEALAHQELPFDKLVELLQPNRSEDRAPLFQAALVLENMPLEFPAESGLRCQPIAIDNGTSKYDLALLLSEQAGRIAGHAEYATDLFDAATIDRLLAALARVLSAAVADPDGPISRLPLLDEAQRRRIVHDLNPSVRPAPAACLHQLFEEHARREPDRPAIRFRGTEWTYGDVDRAANRLARRLALRGAGPDRPVAVCLERSPQSVIAMLGVLKSGGTYAPLDPDLPVERMAFMLKDTQARMVVTDRRLAGRLPVTDAETVLVEDLALDAPGENPGPPRIGLRPEHLAYILYTSGSTGRPKGVMIEHRGAAAFVAGFNRFLRIAPECRVLHFFSLSSDGSISDVFSALASGACLVVAGPEVMQEHDGLQRLVRSERVTTATLTPSMLPLLEPDGLPDLVTVCSVGEAIGADLAAKWARPGRRLVNGYGVTEAACGACLGELPAAMSSPARPTIGRPLDHVQIHVLDANLQPLPLGVPGEICIGGVQVGRGYLNRPELTARSFVPDPFRPGPDARLYRTGDLGRRLPDGSIDLLGRMDQQINLRGHRVEPGEIAAALERHPAVRQAVVVAREDRPGESRLVAYVVAKGEAASGLGLAAELRRHAAAQLPRHMVPAAIVLVDSLPRSAQGKLDRAALPAPSCEGDSGEAPSDYVAPRDAHERLVAEVWQGLLGVARVGVRDSFFDLGGHSMLAVQAMAEIEKRAGRRLPLSALFHEPTVEHLARLLRGPEGGEAESSLVPLAGAARGSPLFCVHPAGGTVFCYRALAEELAGTRPVFGLQAAGVDGRHAPHRTIESMAAHYIRAMRAVQPVGPYLLAGWSLGGNVAQEMACQLAAEGHEVAMLALLDAAALPSDRQPDARDFLPMLMEFFPAEEHLRLEEIEAMPLAGQLDYFVRRAAQAGIVAQEDLAAARHVFDVFKASMTAIVEHRQKPYPGRLTLFAAEHREAWLHGAGDPQLGWGPWARSVEVRPVPGGHIQMVHRPYVQALAARLRECLDSAAGG